MSHWRVWRPRNKRSTCHEGTDIIAHDVLLSLGKLKTGVVFSLEFTFVSTATARPATGLSSATAPQYGYCPLFVYASSYTHFSVRQNLLAENPWQRSSENLSQSAPIRIPKRSCRNYIFIEPKLNWILAGTG